MTTPDPLRFAVIARAFDSPLAECVRGLRQHAEWAALYTPDAAPVSLPPELGSPEVQPIESFGRIPLDFAIAAADETVSEHWLNHPRHGVWTIAYDDRSARPQSVIIATLYRLRGPSLGIPLASCATPYLPANVSESRRQAAVAAADLPRAVCRRLQSGLDLPCSSTAVPVPALAPRSRVREAVAWSRDQIAGALLSETWNIGVVHAPIERFLDPSFRPEIHWTPAPSSPRFLADPFGVHRGGADLEIFAEEFDYGPNRGWICCFEFNSGRFTPPRTIIDAGVHMSYPFILEHRGRRLCIPECQMGGAVDAWQSAPDGSWARAGRLIPGATLLDATPVLYEGRWWLFATDATDFPDARLLIWHAPDLLGPWQPHGANPVKCDVRSARPGGTPFFHDGVLYRPAQDSSRSYGSALVINRVLRLTPDEFREEVAVRIPPPRGTYNDGIHTLSAAGPYTLIDAKRMRLLPDIAARRIRFKISRLLGTSF